MNAFYTIETNYVLEVLGREDLKEYVEDTIGAEVSVDFEAYCHSYTGTEEVPEVEVPYSKFAENLMSEIEEGYITVEDPQHFLLWIYTEIINSIEESI